MTIGTNRIDPATPPRLASRARRVDWRRAGRTRHKSYVTVSGAWSEKRCCLYIAASSTLPRKSGAQHLVVDAPADVLVPAGRAAVRPPGVMLGLRVHFTKRIHVPHVAEQLVEPRAFLGQEPGIFLVRFPVAQVDRLVRDVPVTAKHDSRACGASGCAGMAGTRRDSGISPVAGLRSTSPKAGRPRRRSVS